MTKTTFTWTPATGVICEGDALPELVRARVNKELHDPQDGGIEVLDDCDREWRFYGDGEYGITLDYSTCFRILNKKRLLDAA